MATPLTDALMGTGTGSRNRRRNGGFYGGRDPNAPPTAPSGMGFTDLGAQIAHEKSRVPGEYRQKIGNRLVRGVHPMSPSTGSGGPTGAAALAQLQQPLPPQTNLVEALFDNAFSKRSQEVPFGNQGEAYDSAQRTVDERLPYGGQMGIGDPQTRSISLARKRERQNSPEMQERKERVAQRGMQRGDARSQRLAMRGLQQQGLPPLMAALMSGGEDQMGGQGGNLMNLLMGGPHYAGTMAQQEALTPLRQSEILLNQARAQGETAASEYLTSPGKTMMDILQSNPDVAQDPRVSENLMGMMGIDTSQPGPAPAWVYGPDGTTPLQGEELVRAGRLSGATDEQITRWLQAITPGATLEQPGGGGGIMEWLQGPQPEWARRLRYLPYAPPPRDANEPLF